MAEEKSEKEHLIGGGGGTSVQLNGTVSRSPNRARSLQQTLRDIATGPERLWVVMVFSLVAVLGSALMGLALGYSSPSIVNFDQLVNKDDPPQLQYKLGTGLAQQGLFGVRVLKQAQFVGSYAIVYSTTSTSALYYGNVLPQTMRA